MYTPARFAILLATSPAYPLARAALTTDPHPIEFTEGGVYAVATNEDVYYPYDAPDGTAEAAAAGVEDLLRRHGAYLTPAGNLSF